MRSKINTVIDSMLAQIRTEVDSNPMKTCCEFVDLLIQIVPTQVTPGGGCWSPRGRVLGPQTSRGLTEISHDNGASVRGLTGAACRTAREAASLARSGAGRRHHFYPSPWIFFRDPALCNPSLFHFGAGESVKLKQKRRPTAAVWSCILRRRSKELAQRLP